MNQLNEQDIAALATIRSEGIGIVRGVLSGREIAAVRQDFARANQDLGKGSGEPGLRDRLSGPQLLDYPHLADLYSHPRIMAIVSAMLDDSEPWVWQIITNRYNPEHPGVRKHSDSFSGELSQPFSRQAMAVFLDDIDETSGSLTYVPGTHFHHFQGHAQAGVKAPDQDAIDAGDYIPTTVNAGDVVLRVPEVWHAVRPIHRLRRYVTASYNVRQKLSSGMEERLKRELQIRTEIPEEKIPSRLKPYWYWNEDK